MAAKTVMSATSEHFPNPERSFIAATFMPSLLLYCFAMIKNISPKVVILKWPVSNILLIPDFLLLRMSGLFLG